MPAVQTDVKTSIRNAKGTMNNEIVCKHSKNVLLNIIDPKINYMLWFDCWVVQKFTRKMVICNSTIFFCFHLLVSAVSAWCRDSFLCKLIQKVLKNYTIL